MANSSNISLPLKKCMKCGEESALLLSSCTPFGMIGNCNHKFCQNCFRKENTASNLTCSFSCPCCHTPFYESIQSIDEAIIIGEVVATTRNHIYPKLISSAEVGISADDLIYLDKMNKSVVEKLGTAILLNPANFYTLYLLFVSCNNCHTFLVKNELSKSDIEFYGLKLFNYSLTLLDHPKVPASARYDVITGECCYELARMFHKYRNWSPALKYSKLAYEHCLREPGHTDLSICKALYLASRTDFASLPPLRFAVGDEVEFLHERATGGEWKLGRIVELYYWERGFDLPFSAPYRLQLLDDSDATDQPPVYTWVKADIDHYVRKPGVRSIEGTRYQARLDAKVAKLARVFCSREFIQELYLTLAQDSEFVHMLQSVWKIELSNCMLHLYRMLVMHRQPLVRTDSGYHVPSSEEVIAGIRTYFDPAHLSDDASTKEEDYLEDIRAEIISMLTDTRISSINVYDDNTIQGHLLNGVRSYIAVLTAEPIPTSAFAGLLDRPSNFTVPLEISEAISRVSILPELRRIQRGATSGHSGTRLRQYLNAWIGVHTCLENPNAGPACECPFVYFFVKFCLERDLGVPKLALALYDRMNMQLSREFIRCANPTCEHSKLDKSTGKVKFKQCSRCKAVIYCCRECQVAHYPEHKKLCRENSNG